MRGRRSAISRNRQKSRAPRMRLDDLAKACGVSIATVSRALAGEKGVQRRNPSENHRSGEGGGLFDRRRHDRQTVIVLAASGAAMLDYMRNQFTWHVLDGLKERAERLGFEIVTRQIVDTDAQQAVLAEGARRCRPSAACCSSPSTTRTLLTAASRLRQADRAGQRRRSLHAAWQRHALQPLRRPPGGRAPDRARPSAHRCF